MVFISLGVAKMFAKILKIPYYVLGTFIMLLAITGCYAYQGNMTDVYLMIFGGIFGYFFKKYHFSTSALILGLVLGPMTEGHFRRGMSMNQDSLMAFFGRPITMAIMLIFVAMYGYAFYKSFKAKRSKAG